MAADSGRLVDGRCECVAMHQGLRAGEILWRHSKESVADVSLGVWGEQRVEGRWESGRLQVARNRGLGARVWSWRLGNNGRERKLRDIGPVGLFGLSARGSESGEVRDRGRVFNF